MNRPRSLLMAKLLILCALMLAALPSLRGQELKAVVEVNTDKIQGTNKDVFESLQNALNDYLNNTKFSSAQIAANERVECRLILTVAEYADDRIKGELAIQSSRPVYNSTYTTTLLNFRDNKVEFDYRLGDNLIYNEMEAQSNLTAILDFYANLILAIDFDSFSPKGGQPFIERMSAIVQRAQSGGETGWKPFEDNRNRAALLATFTDVQMAPFRDLIYAYHRRGLDEMVTSPDKGRAAITETISTVLPALYEADPMAFAITLFRDAKLDELVNIYSKSPQAEREAVAKMLLDIYPTDRTRIADIKTPPDPNQQR
ncbi:MAG: DUF4835 family protein [Pseudoflavonifractor sp.]|nr:DUF4835 family protein [Alloprevotella sp.]MCM1117158.1 DUF4835 family protein [Pseudoflavonifractor sp.]